MTGAASMMIAVVAAVVAAGAGLLVALPWLTGRVNARMFTEMLIKLIKAGNLDRAKKLCGAAPGSIFVVASARCLEAFEHTPDNEAETIAQLRDAFVGAVRDGVKQRRRRNWLGLVSMIGVFVSAYFVVAERLHPAILVGSAIAGLCLATAQGSAKRLARDTVTHGEKIYSALAESRRAS